MPLALKWIRRIAIAVVGFTVLLIGVAMIVLPGPAFIVIPAGLGILALEFAWAKRWLTSVGARLEPVSQASLTDRQIEDQIPHIAHRR